MLTHDGNTGRRLHQKVIEAELVVVGGGMAGACAAITAAREGLHVALVQDRPVLGGNASSEVRLWMVGATSHMGNNNRWAREGGVLNEIMVENCFRNPEGNPVLFDTVVLEKVIAEPRLTLLLNTAVYDASQDDHGHITSVTAFCSQNSTKYMLRAPLFCDASGDGLLGFLSGAAFRIGVESYSEFGELLAPAASGRELLGHTIYFYTRDAGRPVRYVPPAYALDDITKIPRYRRFNTKDQGTDLWWIEYGGSRDTVYETEEIKWELWRVVYGVWNHIKNSGEFPDAETLTLDWVGLIPGKRESRRFEGDYMLVQQDIIEQRAHYDAVSVGGWAIDHHPVDNIYSEGAPCTQWHSKGVYQIPYRTMYSRNVPNLFLAGRIISASHVAFGSSRVMATCAHNGQAVGMAAAICTERNLRPRDLSARERIGELQLRLLRSGQYIPRLKRDDPDDVAQSARVTASSCMQRLDLKPADACCLDESRALLLPLSAGQVPEVRFSVRHRGATELMAELRTCSRTGSYTPDVLVDAVTVSLPLPAARLPGQVERKHGATPQAHFAVARRHRQHFGDGVAVAQREAVRGDAVSPNEHGEFAESSIALQFNARLSADMYAFVVVRANPLVDVFESSHLVTGVTTVAHRQNVKVAKGSRQIPPPGCGVDEFEFWIPERRPRGRNLACTIDLPPRTFAAENVINGFQRPTNEANAWVASPDDPQPTLNLHWDEPQAIGRIVLAFDPDWDHPLETVVMQHSEREMPTTIRSFRIRTPSGQVLHECFDNYQTRVTADITPAVITRGLVIELDHPSPQVPASVFEVQCF
ncbi:MAG: FAD-binding dehydrogenase [Planctomycetaceae bacterium]|nr:FAD-binding dehydrogenase [Planctomycetaceae bacterium]